MRRSSAVTPPAWTAYYRGLVRASLHRPLGRSPVGEAQTLVAQLAQVVGRTLRGRRDFVDVVLPQFLGPHALEIIHDSAHELEYRWHSFPCDDLVACADQAACAAGMQFHEAIARTVMPEVVDFRALEARAGPDAACRVLVRLASASGRAS